MPVKKEGLIGIMLTRVQKGSSIYTVYELDENSVVDTTSLLMINNNRSRGTGLAPITLEEMNGRCSKMLFDVTGRITLREYSAKNISQEDFRLMLTNLVDTIEGFDEYMIDVRTVLLDLDSVFINEFDHSISFLCIAVKDTAFDVKLYEFFRDVVQSSYVITNDNTVSYFNKAWNVITSKNGFSLRNMKLAMSVTDEQAVSGEPAPQPAQAISQPAPAVQPAAVSAPASAPAQSSAADEAVEPVPMPEKEKSRKSLFGGLFSKDKDKDKDKDKEKESKKKKQPQEKPAGFEGGLSGYKNGSKPANISGRAPAVDLAPEQPAPQPAPKPIQVMTSGSSQPAPLNVQFSSQQPQRQTPPPVQFSAPQPAAPSPVQYAAAPQLVKPAAVMNDAGSEKTVIDDDTVTKLETSNAKLINKVTGIAVEINKIPFKVGRRSADVDHCIPVETVSKLHATITKQGDTYMITDNFSGNHTFLNGVMLVPGKETVLTNNAVIGFYKEEYIFVI